MSLDTDLRAAMMAQLATVSGLPPTSRWQGRLDESTGFSPTIGQTWLRLSMRWGRERLRTMPARNALVERPGWLSCEVFEPVDPATSTLEDTVRAILDAFPPGLTLPVGAEAVRIVGSRRWSALREDHWVKINVDIDWQLITVNTLA